MNDKFESCRWDDEEGNFCEGCDADVSNLKRVFVGNSSEELNKDESNPLLCYLCSYTDIWKNYHNIEDPTDIYLKLCKHINFVANRIIYSLENKNKNET